MLSTSDYLKIQADLLIARNLLARLQLEEFLRVTSQLLASGTPLLDRQGLPVATDPVQMSAIAEAAKELVRAAGETRDAVLRRGMGRAEAVCERSAAAV